MLVALKSKSKTKNRQIKIIKFKIAKFFIKRSSSFKVRSMIYLFDDLDGKIYFDPFFLQYILFTFFYTGYTGLNAKFPQQ